MDVKLSVLGPTSGCAVLRFKTGRREVQGSIPGRACRPSRSEFSAVVSEIRLNRGWDPLEGTHSSTGSGSTKGQ